MNNMLTKSESEIKNSFAPISNEYTEILILGSLPGEKSLEKSEYYAHPQNRFWRIIAAITKNSLPVSYGEKRDLLLANKIGVWDVVRQAKRKGSLDVNIIEEVPNDLDSFIADHKNLKIIGFNGAKAAKVFDKYGLRQERLKYFALPSSSPANAGITFDGICERWAKIIE